MLSPLIGIGAYISIQFGAYNNAKNVISQFTSELKPYHYIAAGVRDCSLSPLECIRSNAERGRVTCGAHPDQDATPNQHQLLQGILIILYINRTRSTASGTSSETTGGRACTREWGSRRCGNSAPTGSTSARTRCCGLSKCTSC